MKYPHNCCSPQPSQSRSTAAQDYETKLLHLKVSTNLSFDTYIYSEGGKMRYPAASTPHITPMKGSTPMSNLTTEEFNALSFNDRWLAIYNLILELKFTTRQITKDIEKHPNCR